MWASAWRWDMEMMDRLAVVATAKYTEACRVGMVPGLAVMPVMVVAAENIVAFAMMLQEEEAVKMVVLA